MAEQRTAHMHSPTLGNSRAYMGGILTIPVSGGSARGRLAVVEATGRPGTEPPPHFHEWEDELFRVLEGRAEFFCGEEHFAASAGDYVFIPQGVPHAMRFLTPAVRVTMAFSASGQHPVAADRYFLALSELAASRELPAAGTAETYATAADLAHAARAYFPPTRRASSCQATLASAPKTAPRREAGDGTRDHVTAPST